MANGKRAAIYARISRAEAGVTAAHDDLSLQRQVALCEREVEQNGWTLIHSFIEAPGTSGFADVERPQFQRLRSAIKAGHIDVVVTYAIDRLGRRAHEVLAFARELEIARVDLASTKGHVDSYSLHILSMLAEMEAKANSERQGAKYDQRFAAGLPKAGKSGYGWEFLTKAQAAKEGWPDHDWPRLVPNEADTLRGMVKRLLAGEGEARVVQWANGAAERLPRKTKRGAEEHQPLWTISTMVNKLKSPMLAGYVQRPHETKDDGRPISWRIRPGAWIGQVETILSFAEWQQVAERELDFRPLRTATNWS